MPPPFSLINDAPELLNNPATLSVNPLLFSPMMFAGILI